MSLNFSIRSNQGLRLFTLATAVLSVNSVPMRVSAQNTEEVLEEIVVFGRGTQLLGAAEAASEGSVGGADLLVRPMLRVAEVLEVVPGMVAVQHSGSGKANQYFLRGFNLDHGTDFLTEVDGVPWNLRTHGHGQGYLDVNGLLPEIIERIDYRKGPYRADIGDFATVGGAYITTIERLEQPYLALEAGENGWARVAGGSSVDIGDGVFTSFGEYKTYDGPWQLQEGLEHVSIWSKFTKPTQFGSLSATLSGYEGDWHPTEQVPERAIGSAACPTPYCTLDHTAGGNTSRWIAAVQLDGSDWSARTYVQFYDWYMQSNPTYDYQINQFDKRTTLGGRYDKDLISQSQFELTVGTDVRYDNIGPVGLDHYDAGSFVENISDNDVVETSLGAYVEANWLPTDNLRFLVGARADYYDFDVKAANLNSFAGTKTASQVSPKFGIAYSVGDNVELYGNWGEGFHSNDARGIVNTADPVPGLATGTGYEAGTRVEVGDLRMTAAYWWLHQDSELIFVGDSNSVEPKGGSRREGYEFTFFWRPIDWLGIDAVYTGSTARYVDNPDGPYIEGAVENAGQLGLAATKDNWEASVRLRYLGAYALTADNAHRAQPETTVSMRGAYTLGKRTFYAEVINVFDNDGKDIVYWYEAYAPGFDPPGQSSADIDCSVTNCRVSRAQEPRTLRVGLKWAF